MGEAQVIAAGIVGFVWPFVQESLIGAKVSGRIAAAITIAMTFIVATLTYWITGGFATAAAAPAFNFVNPREFFNFWFGVWGPVYILSQALYSLTTKHSEAPPATGPIQTVAEKIQPIINTGPKEEVAPVTPTPPPTP